MNRDEENGLHFWWDLVRKKVQVVLINITRVRISPFYFYTYCAFIFVVTKSVQGGTYINVII